MNNYKWHENVIFSSRDMDSFLLNYYNDKEKVILYILGKGFDPRQNNGIAKLLRHNQGASIECLIVDYKLERYPTYKRLIERNNEELKRLLSDKIRIINLQVDLLIDYGLGIRNLNRNLQSLNIEKFTDIIVDISAMPKSIYFNIINSLFFKINNNGINLFAMVSENIEMDRAIQEKSLGEVGPMFGFSGKYGREAIIDPLIVSIPIMGESRFEALKKTNYEINAEAHCPILPFPSRDLRRSDNLLKEYHNLFDNILRMSASDFSYVDERNPFELYITICGLIDNYKKSLKPLDRDFIFGISLFASKLLSLGVLLVALDEKKKSEITIFNVNVDEYAINVDDKTFISMNNNSELFMIWIDGDAYK